MHFSLFLPVNNAKLSISRQPIFIACVYEEFCMATSNIGFKSQLKQLMQPQHIQQLAQLCQREDMKLTAADITKVYNFLLTQISNIAAYALGHNDDLDFDQRRDYQVYRPKSHPELPTSVEVIYKNDHSLPDFLISRENTTRGSFKKYRRAINLSVTNIKHMLVGIKKILVVAGEKEKNSLKRYKMLVKRILEEVEISQQLHKINAKYFDCQEYIGTQFYPKPNVIDKMYPQFKEGSMMATLLCKPAICSLKEVVIIDKNVLPANIINTLQQQVNKYRGKGNVASLHKQLARSLLHGLEIMHSNGYKHLDIKLTNILLCQDQNYYLKLTDFGRTKVPNQAGNKDASPRWASPQVYDYIVVREGRGKTRAKIFTEVSANYPIYAVEILQQRFPIKTMQDQVSIKDDMWAVGVVLFELYTGLYPRVDEYTDAVLKVNPLLRGLLDPDESKRIDCVTALKLIEESKSIIPPPH